VFDGNTAPTTVKVTLTNTGSSSTFLQSANINLPTQLNVVQGSGSPSANVSTSNQQVQVRGIKVQAGKTFVATFQVNTACGGTFAWPAAQAWSGDNQTGNPLDYQSGTTSTGVTTALNTGCYLGFVSQPTDTADGAKIADHGASQGGPVTVGLFTSGGTPMTSCPTGFTTTCNAIVGKTPNGVNDGALANGTDSLTQPLTGNPLVATFSNLSVTGANTPEQFRLTAVGDGSFAPMVNSGSFLIADANSINAATCDQLGHCTFVPQSKLHHGALTDSFADVVGVQNFNFMTLAPFALGAVPQGCTSRIDLGVTGFAESDSRRAGQTSTITIRFYVDHDQLQARYGKNVGQQFIEICVGGRPVDTSTGQIYDCNDPNSPVGHDVVGGNTNGWVGDEVKAGRFTGKTAKAVCNDDGYYWGIIGSYQDKLPAGNPVVTNWGGQNIGGNNYRFFDMTVPAGWDWRSGP
ncbi:MAG: hypothetical protein ACTHKS_07500, partial [Gaiellaceae bacterium]